MVATDTSFPLERVQFIADDSGAVAVVASDSSLELALELVRPDRPLIRIDVLPENTTGENLKISSLGESPAQIVYTSDSTGRPKGVIRNHARMIYSASLLINATHISSSDRLLTIYTLSFGAGLTEILKGLLAGAALFPFDVRKEGLSKLPRFLNDNEVTYFSSSPSTFRYFANEIKGNDVFPTVRLVELGSEPLSRREVQLFWINFSVHAILVNRFASSET